MIRGSQTSVLLNRASLTCRQSRHPSKFPPSAHRPKAASTAARGFPFDILKSSKPPKEIRCHLARADCPSLSWCGLSLNSNPEHRKRRGDRRLSETIPDKQFTALCSTCDRKATGKPEPTRPSPELLRSPKLTIVVP